MDGSSAASLRTRLGELARLFLKLGFTAFGGPAAHVALMEDEVVKRRGWMTRERFLDLLAAVNFIPGPNSTELAIHVGLVRAGYLGMLVAGVCFIVPAVLIILPIGWFYVRYGQVPAVGGPLLGIRAVMLAVVVAALVRFARSGLKDRFTIGLAVVTAALAWAGHRYRVAQYELILLMVAATAGLVWQGGRKAVRGGESRSRVLPLVLPAAAAGGAWAMGKLPALLLFFLKVGATLFGTGYVLVSYLQAGLVERHQFMTQAQLTDAVAVGQVTPGPLLTTATFIGYVLGFQWSGGSHARAAVAAALCTVAIFLPSFAFVPVVAPVFERLRRSAAAASALDAINAAVIALLAVTSMQLAGQAVGIVYGAVLAAAALVIMLVWDVNATWLMLAGAGIGWGLWKGRVIG